MIGSSRIENIISDWIGLDWIGLDWIESDQIRVSRYEWIGSEQPYFIGARGSD